MFLYRPNERRGEEFEWLKTLQGPQLETFRKVSGSENLLKKMCQTAPTSPHVVWEDFKKNYSSSSKNKLQHIQLSDTTGTSNGTGFYDQMKQNVLLFSIKHSRWVWWTQRLKSTPCVQWNILLCFFMWWAYFSARGPGHWSWRSLDTWHHGFYQIQTDKKSTSDWLCYKSYNGPCLDLLTVQ